MQNKYLNQNTKLILSSLVVAVILLVAVLQGLKIGKLNAQAQSIIITEENLLKGLQYFYNDQERFPTTDEFADQSTMLKYFSPFPPENFVSSKCIESFIYKRVSAHNYSLNFCLPREVHNYNDGWNKINVVPVK